MCLTTKQRRPKVSARKTTCYKVVEKLNGGYRTPLQKKTICDGSIEGAKMSCAFMRTDKHLGFFDKTGSMVVGKGVIHAYTEYEKAVWNASAMSNFFFPRRFIVVECTIPPFTRYYEGDANEIAAKRIVFGKEVWP